MKKNNIIFNLIMVVGILFLSISTTYANEICPTAMDSLKLEQVKQRINSNDFDEAKLKIIKSALDKNCLTAVQLKEILSLLSFEEDKINIIKLGFKKLTDPTNIEVVLSVLEFDSSKKEVNDFIATGK